MRGSPVTGGRPAPPAERGGEPCADVGAVRRAYLEAIVRGARDEAAHLVLRALSEGVELRDLYLRVLQPAQRDLGVLWHDGAIDVGAEHLATAITESVMALLYPRLFDTVRIGRRLVGACVEGELHELGLRMLCDLFELEGWDTFYLGANVPAVAVAEAVSAYRAEVVALSATVRGDLAVVREIVQAVRAHPDGVRVRILVGGAALASAEACRAVGADGFADDAEGALELAHALVSVPRRTARSHVVPPDAPGAPALPVPRLGAGDGDLLARMAVLHSEHINSHRELAKYRVELARLGREKNVLIGMLAHDLRNPLGVVRSYSRLLRDPELTPAEREEILADVEASTTFVLGLVEEVLDLTAIEHGRLALSLAPLDLAELARAAARLEGVAAQRKGSHVECACSAPCPVRGDAGKLRQVLTNLISNGVKYSPPGSVVTVVTRAEERWAVVEVRDRGVGIEPADVDKLFVPFSRLRAGGTAGERSTGLGLAIVRRIVDGHGGDITVASTPGQGSTFRVRLPLAAGA